MLNDLTGPAQRRQNRNKLKQLRLKPFVMHRERHQALIKTGLAEKSVRIFIDQLKNTRTALLDVALKRSHWRRLVCARALGKMQQKAITGCKNLLGNTRTRGALSEIQNEAAVRNSRS